MSKWIPVSERMPPYDGKHTEYLVVERHKDPTKKAPVVRLAEWECRDTETGPYWTGCEDGWTYVSHWMPLPGEPKEAKG